MSKIAGVATAAVFALIWSGSAFLSLQAQPPVKRIEMTETDLFATRGWKSSQVSVLGFHLGMSRKEAVDRATRRGLDLETDQQVPGCLENSCEVCHIHGVCVGLWLRFGTDGQVRGMSIMRPPDVAASAVGKACVTHLFKGQTRLFFDHPSKELRLTLFGDEARSKEPGRANTSIEYDYPRLGLTVVLSPFSPRSPSSSESEGDMIVSLDPPQEQ